MSRTVADFKRWNELQREQEDIGARLTATVGKSADLMWAIMVKKFGHGYDWNSLPKELRWVVWFRKTGEVRIGSRGIYVTRDNRPLTFPMDDHAYLLPDDVVHFTMWALAKRTRVAIRAEKRRIKVAADDAKRSDLRQRFVNAEREFLAAQKKLRDIDAEAQASDLHKGARQFTERYADVQR